MAPIVSLAHAPPRSHKRPKIAKGPLSTVVVKRANGTSNNLGNLHSIINASRLFIQSDLEGRIMLLPDNGASEFLKDECERGF
jgi:hypothetical protein